MSSQTAKGEVHIREQSGHGRHLLPYEKRIDHAGQTHRARVKALLAADATRATRKDEAHQTRATLAYLNAELANGWDPAQEREHTIEIGNPPGQRAPAWWKFWWAVRTGRLYRSLSSLIWAMVRLTKIGASPTEASSTSTSYDEYGRWAIANVSGPSNTRT